MKEKATIYDIAKRLNISAATVSRALNDHSKTSEKTKKLVLKTAEELGYEQNRLALALKSGKSKNIGVIVPRIDSNFFGSIIRGIEEELQQKGYHVMICQTHEKEEKQIENINALLNAQVDGILLSVTKNTEDTSIFDRVLQKHTPLIFFDRKIEIKGVSSVTIDDFKGGYIATEHLIKQGCKHVAHLTALGYQSVNIYQGRLEGYKQALKDYDIPFNEDLVIPVKNDLEGGKLAIETLLKLKQQPDAIFSSSDFMLLGGIQELKLRGINVPNDMAVVGFSNEPFTKFLETPISSVDQCPLEIGKYAAQVFLEQLDDPKTIKIEKNLILPPELIIRQSSLKN
ncbi:LacI family DNA-binding transcriptional regulator [Formosa haliotis]|uniref:LacI family DNA-binding transcriptional regulator n=1 Tax=Formosa haliotis TaxID=1555194 RepID=UPI0008269DC6|nr:LacI family DNA-binding transcriptional regulator [Formosa haliotis]